MVRQIVKRNDDIVDYDLKKIENAIFKASNEVVDRKEAEEISKVVSELVDKKLNEDFKDSKYPTVEEIQETVEDSLIEKNYSKIAKRYIIYRANRDKVRKDKSSSILSPSFLSKYKHQPNPFPTEFGEFIYYRTYSRWRVEETRREYWWETVKRAVEYNCSLAPTTRKEAEELYDNVYHFRQFLAGRTLWTGGTEASLKYPMSNYNCAFTIINDFQAYEDLFYLLMIGAGVGVRVLPEDVEKLPAVRTNMEIKHEYYEPVAMDNRQEITSFEIDKGKATIIVGDSKEGKKTLPLIA